MPWCPNCKNEYVDGITACADCGCALVDSLQNDCREPVIFGDRQQMETLKDFLEYNGLHTAFVEEDPDEHVFELYVDDSEMKKAKKATAIFLQQEAEKAPADVVAEIARKDREAVKNLAGAGVYKDSAQKAEDFKSSGYVLIGVGAAGLIVIALLISGVIPFHLFGSAKYLSYGVMGALFFIFVVTGIFSMRSSKSYKVKAQSESNLKEEILNWCRENLTAEAVDEHLFDASSLETGEEAKYFKRTEKMRTLVSDKFLNIDEALLEQLVDDFYSELFEA